MRENWDYVTMDTYAANMAAHTRHAVGAIEHWRKRAEQAERALSEVVLAAGGKVRVWDGLLKDPRRKIDITMWFSPADSTVVFAAELTNT